MTTSALAAFARAVSPDHAPAVPSSVAGIRTELLAGLTVALALVPEAVAFAFVAGVNPLVGLYAAFIMCLVLGLFGGRPGMISGATGSTAIVMVPLVAQHGVEYLFPCVVLAGILQILAGIFRLGKFMRLVPHPVMLGFVNGLAIVIFLAQLNQFKVPGADGVKHWMQGGQLALMLGVVVLSMLVIWLLPRWTKAFPAPLAGIVIAAVVVIGLNLNIPRVGDLAHMKGGLPQIHLPQVPMTLETLRIIFPTALIIAAVGLLESLLTLNLVGEITGKRGGASQECVAQGVGNMASGFFGSMGGCAMIGQSMINVTSGGRTRLAAVAAAIFLILFIVVASPLIEQIPVAGLVGVMFMVVIGTFAWNTFRILGRVPRIDAAVIILVTVVTVFTDLAMAVVIGVIISALAFAWKSARHIHGRSRMTPEGAKVYQIEGPLFFGSVEDFNLLFDPEGDPSHVIVDFAESRVLDQSALAAIEALAVKYEGNGKSLVLRHLSRDCHALLNRAGQLMVDSSDDPEYGVAVDYTVRPGALGAGH
ncbi:SulP family inorganic anion transporter [Acidimangrovimonas sediminis]|uniref:SulP family inorganic anion transporter n=1 Tax=Acidimangrovimonas sediminis TaxID=2056283 RepID=UPI000C80F082|nr:SulP family inorganic anion transporter [Acidimangrovimonas sediminis]